MERKEIYKKKAEAKLAETRADLDELKAKAKSASASAKAEVHETIDELESTYARARKRFDAFVEAGEDAWEDLVKGFEEAWKDVSGGARKALAHLREAPAKPAKKAVPSKGSVLRKKASGKPRPSHPTPQCLCGWGIDPDAKVKAIGSLPAEHLAALDDHHRRASYRERDRIKAIGCAC